MFPILCFLFIASACSTFLRKEGRMLTRYAWGKARDAVLCVTWVLRAALPSVVGLSWG